MQPVVVYTRSTPRCSFCVHAKALLAIEDIAFTEIDTATLSDQGRADFLARLDGLDPVTVPQIFIGGKRIGGLAELKKLADYGGLHQMVAGE
jgi:glutaredoxin